MLCRRSPRRPPRRERPSQAPGDNRARSRRSRSLRTIARQGGGGSLSIRSHIPRRACRAARGRHSSATRSPSARRSRPMSWVRSQRPRAGDRIRPSRQKPRMSASESGGASRLMSWRSIARMVSISDISESPPQSGFVYSSVRTHPGVIRSSGAPPAAFSLRQGRPALMRPSPPSNSQRGGQKARAPHHCDHR